MNKTLAVALGRCPEIHPTTLEEFLGALLDRDPDDLARLPGTPGTVLAAQFTCYAKSSVTLSETLRRQREHAGTLADIIWRIKAAKDKPSELSRTTPHEEAARDSDPLPEPKQPAACAAGTA